MDHKVAERENAVDRYLLNEFTPEERMEFEEHLFDCPICADQVRKDAIFADNVRQVMVEEERGLQTEPSRKAYGSGIRSWFEWLRPASLIPAIAALGLAFIVGYQNLVFIPRLEQPQVLSSEVIPPLTRDQGLKIGVNRNSPEFNLNFEVDSPQVFSSYECEFQNDSGSKILTLDSGPRQVASFTLDLLLPTKRFPPARYVMILRSNSEPRTEVHRYRFVIEDAGGTRR